MERIITVTDDKGTVLRPIDATFEVDYKYSGEAAPERVLEGEVKRGGVVANPFPEADPTKTLEYSEISITVKDTPQGWDAYSSKSRRFVGRTPVKDSPKEGVDMQLPFKGTIPTTKQEKREALQNRRDVIFNALQQRYPPKQSKQ